LEAVGNYVLPIYNLAIFIFVQFPLQVLLWFITGEASSHVMLGLRSLGGAAPIFTAEVKAFIAKNSPGSSSLCESSRVICTNVSQGGVLCTNLDAGSIATLCLDPSRRELALETFFQQIQSAFGHFIMAIGTSCRCLDTISKVALFPTADYTFWKSADKIINGILHATIVAPLTSAQRCQLAGGFFARPAMCTPDFGPAFEFFASAAKLLGTSITHWIDVLYIFIFTQQDIETACSHESDFSSIWDDQISKRMFGSNTTILIRMTPSTFALSDGTSVVYVNDNNAAGGEITRTYSPSAWPVPVNPEYGIARVMLPGGVNVQDGGVGLMGCNCRENATAMLECSIITKTGDVWILPVKWSLSSETQLLSCKRLRISVQTIRWPHRRVVTVTTSFPQQECGDGSSFCLVGDVAIYAVPICGSPNGVESMACFPEKYFTKGVCFPYCMALHMQHEGLQPITMRGASEWEQGVVMAKRDCVPLSSNNGGGGGGGSSSTTTTTCTVSSMDTISQSIPTEGGGGGVQCTHDITCTSTVVNKSNVVGYGKESNVIPYINSVSNDGVRLILDGQPLVLAAGVQMRMYKYPADSQTYFADFLPWLEISTMSLPWRPTLPWEYQWFRGRLFLAKPP